MRDFTLALIDSQPFHVPLWPHVPRRVSSWNVGGGYIRSGGRNVVVYDSRFLFAGPAGQPFHFENDIRPKFVSEATISSDGRFYACLYDDGSLETYDLDSGERMAQFPSQLHSGIVCWPICAVVFVLDNTHLAVLEVS